MSKDFNRDYGVSKEELNSILQNYEHNKNDNIAYKDLTVSNLKDEEFNSIYKDNKLINATLVKIINSMLNRS